MTPQEIQVGTRLELEQLDKNEEKIDNTYISQLLEHKDSNYLVISAPIFEAKLIFISPQAHIRITLMHHRYGLLGFTAIVTRTEFRGKVAVLIVQPDSDLTKIQRRTYYRQDCITDVIIRLGEKDLKAEGNTTIKAFTKNVSGAGACVVTKVDIPKNSTVNIELMLKNNVKINAKCIVVRNIQFEVKNTKNYELGLHFTDISQKDQDSLIKYIFEQQRKALKN